MKTPKLNILDFALLADCVMIEPCAATTVDGLVKPESYDDKPEFGLVIKVGDGKMLDDGTVVPLKMQPGDYVYFGKYSSIKIRSDGKDFLIIRDYDVMALQRNEQTRKKV
jgi:chaperonin GroES